MGLISSFITSSHHSWNDCRKVTWFINVRKFNPWYEIQTPPSRPRIKCNTISDSPPKTLHNCKNLWIQYVQFQELLQIFGKTWCLNLPAFKFFTFRNIMAFYMKQDFLTINFHVLLYWWLSILQGIYLLFISCLIICFWINWVRIYKYTKIKGLHLREVTSLPKSQNVINMVHHFNHRRT